MPIDIAPDAVATVTMTQAQLEKAVADAVAHALKALGFGARKAKPATPKLAPPSTGDDPPRSFKDLDKIPF